MNWGDPNSVAIFAAWGQCIGALGSLLAVAVAVGIAIWSGRQSQKQSQQGLYHSAQPVLVVGSGHIRTQPSLPSLLDWQASDHIINIKNVGTGTAFNIMSVLHAPEFTVENGQRYGHNCHRPWTSTMNSLGINDNELCVHNIADFLFFEENTHIGSYSFLAPSHPDNPSIHEPTYICRVVVTYHDIFKRKHASIFDYDVDGNWTMQKILEDIQYDLYDLKRSKPTVPKVSLLKRFRRRH